MLRDTEHAIKAHRPAIDEIINILVVPPIEFLSDEHRRGFIADLANTIERKKHYSSHAANEADRRKVRKELASFVKKANAFRIAVRRLDELIPGTLADIGITENDFDRYTDLIPHVVSGRLKSHPDKRAFTDDIVPEVFDQIFMAVKDGSDLSPKAIAAAARKITEYSGVDAFPAVSRAGEAAARRCLNRQITTVTERPSK